MALNSDDLVDIGEEHHRAGRLQEAEANYRQALDIDPGHPGALFFLANIAFNDNRLSFAKELIDQLLRDEPSDAEAWHLLGVIAFKEENFLRAMEYFDAALKIQPAYAQAYCSKGHVFSSEGKPDAAISCYRRALALNSQCGEAFFGLASAYRTLGQLDDAISNYRQAIALNYAAVQAYLNLADVLVSHRQIAEARVCYERALAIDPMCAQAYRNFGNFLVETGEIGEGVAKLRQGIAFNPNDAELRINLALVLYVTGRLEEAIDYLRETVKLMPHCAEAYSILLGFDQYSPGSTRDKIIADHIAFGERFETSWRKQWQPRSRTLNPNKRLRVGFVSADLYNHPVGYFLEGVLRELRARDEIDIVIYAMNNKIDALTDRLRSTAHIWLSASALSDDALEQRIRNDSIDILIDLSGHTVPNRLLVFARKPAPLQVTWLGYWETTGLRAMDYILCDRYGVLDGEEEYYVENVWRLPDTRLCFTLLSEITSIAPLPALSSDRITFGCFNNLVKMTDNVIAVWSRILQRLPNSQLFLKSVSFADTRLRDNVRARFASAGVAENKLLLEVSSPRREYFSAYDRVDIALDPFPFPGGTTSVEGLWMGVPMITLRGNSMISRQGESILRNLGMADWIAQNEDDYVELAMQKSADLTRLSQLRGELRDRLATSPLCDARLFAANLTDAFKQMWKQYCLGN